MGLHKGAEAGAAKALVDGVPFVEAFHCLVTMIAGLFGAVAVLVVGGQTVFRCGIHSGGETHLLRNLVLVGA